MELATIELRLDGDMNNTVFKKNVTPAQLSVYAMMHGEDCIASLKVTENDTERTSRDELNRLNTVFQTEHAQAMKHQLYPTLMMQVPTTFKAIGYDPEVLVADLPVARVAPADYNQSEATIAKKIKEQSEVRADAGAAAPVDVTEVNDQFDNTGSIDTPPDSGLDIDSLVNTMGGGNTPPPAPGE